MSRWEQALSSKNLTTICSALLEMWNDPERVAALDVVDPHHQITYIDFDGTEKKSSVIAILLTKNTPEWNSAFLDMAYMFLKKGAPIPTLHQKLVNPVSSTYLKKLSCDFHDLFITLYQYPTIVHQKDEEGMTIIHHVAHLGLVMESTVFYLIIALLLTSEVDLNLQDKQGNTALHIAALNCKDSATCQTVFPALVKMALAKGFDFSILNAEGQAVIHIATKMSKTFYSLHQVNSLDKLLGLAKNYPTFDIDTLSSSGLTALYYAINWMYFDEATILLDAGANPSASGSKNQYPMKVISHYLTVYHFYLDLIKAANSGELNEFCASKKNRAFLHQLNIKKFHVVDSDDDSDDEIVAFANDVANEKKAHQRDFQNNLEIITDLKNRMQSIIHNRVEENNPLRYETFVFWGKTKETDDWIGVNTDLKNLDQAGPGYGF